MSKLSAKFSPINAIDRPSSTEGLPENNNQFSQSGKKSFKRRRLTVKRVALSIGFIIAISLIGTVLVRFINTRGETSPSNQVKSVLSNDEMKDYDSPENKFTIKMPGFPTITRKTYKDGEKDIPLTTYERRINDNAQLYTFEVHDYSGIQLDEKKALEVKLNGAMQNTPGAKLTTSKTGIYNGLNAIEANYTVTEKDKTYDAHIRFVVKESKIYAVILVGGDQAKFDEFANSLRLS